MKEWWQNNMYKLDISNRTFKIFQILITAKVTTQLASNVSSWASLLLVLEDGGSEGAGVGGGGVLDHVLEDEEQEEEDDEEDEAGGHEAQQPPEHGEEEGPGRGLGGQAAVASHALTQVHLDITVWMSGTCRQCVVISLW